MTDELARATSQHGEVVLRRHVDGALELRVNGVFVMDTVRTGTERALADAALALDRPERLLVGGLGLGFTAARLLDDPRVREVVVAEIEPAVVRWMGDGTVAHGPSLMADDRLRVEVADVRDVVEACPDASLDAVLLDVDNGPDFLVLDANARLYEAAFLRTCTARLRPGGALLIWSSTRSAALEEALAAAAGDWSVDEHQVDLDGHPETYSVYRTRRL